MADLDEDGASFKMASGGKGGLGNFKVKNLSLNSNIEKRSPGYVIRSDWRI